MDVPKNTMPAVFYLNDDEINEILKTGSNHSNSRYHIYKLYLYDYPVEERVRFIREDYGYTYQGFYINDNPVSVMYDKNGMSLSYGESMENIFQKLTWEQVEYRIWQLVTDGKYISSREGYVTDERIKKELMNDIKFIYRDYVSEYKSNINEFSHVSFGNDSDYEILNDKEKRNAIIAELYDMTEKISKNQLQIKYRDISYVKDVIKHAEALGRDTVSYHKSSPDSIELISQSFITEDEIDYALCTGSGFQDGKYRIYEHFNEQHDTKENAEFLKNEYGTGGGSHSLPGSDGSGKNYDAKGLE